MLNPDHLLVYDSNPVFAMVQFEVAAVKILLISTETFLQFCFNFITALNAYCIYNRREHRRTKISIHVDSVNAAEFIWNKTCRNLLAHGYWNKI